jgi:hypothetical protein
MRICYIIQVIYPNVVSNPEADLKLSSYSGVVELALTCAREWDPDEQGLSWWQQGCPPNDPRGLNFERRKSAYQCVLSALESADRLLDDACNVPHGRPSKASGQFDISFWQDSK